jgi:hypothetical protein
MKYPETVPEKSVGQAGLVLEENWTTLPGSA